MNSASFLNIAHRGGANLWPENTLEAFAQAISMRVDGIEFDLQLSRDRQLIVHHDLTLNSATTRCDGAWLEPPTPAIMQLTYAQLQNYDVGGLKAGSHYAAQRAGRACMNNVSIPNFMQLCALIRKHAAPELKLYAELKTAMDDDTRTALALADIFIDAVRHAQLIQPIIVISFDWRVLAHIRIHAPELLRGFTTAPFALTEPTHASAVHDTATQHAMRTASREGAPWWGEHDWREHQGTSHGERVLYALANAAHAPTHDAHALWCGYWRDIDAIYLKLAQKLGLATIAWTVNKADDMRRLRDLDVGGIITDRPDILKAL